MKLALIGGRLSHSYSAVIHELFFKLTGITGSYELVEVPDQDSVGEKLDIFDEGGYTGINVTIP
ncbi:MAG: shikimate dehydrogenase, partial [Clostridia bacterium]|nr:shikimate dehydrogenase [Clostridia bacterium]